MVQHSDLKRCKGPSLEDSSPTIDWEGFGKALLEKFWEYDCGQVEGDEIQEMALEHGLIKPVPYDPEKHGEGGLDYGVEPGGEWFVQAWEKDDKSQRS